jgi:hypothetical protein
MGCDPYPVDEDNLTDPPSGSGPETIAVSGYLVRTQEWPEITRETVSGSGLGIVLPEFAGNPMEPISSRRTCLTWDIYI